MSTKYFSLVLSWLLVGAIAVTPVMARTTPAAVTKQEAKIAKQKKRIVEWGTNKNVSVKLKSGGQVNGRIAEIKDENFTVQLVENGQVVNRDISYGDIQNISGKDESSGGWKTAGWIVVGAAAAVGTIFLIGLALAD
ncbi:MAG: hypothetical protein JST84_06135 [Acidobacteria bacterium]|nr:hypothetical protein [Acidobacteriota bacterium]